MKKHSQGPMMTSVTETIVEQPSPPPTGGDIVATSPNPNEGPHPLHGETVDSRITPSVIPPEHDHRTLVLCFDDTRDQFDADSSNIAQLVSLLNKDDGNHQMVYYQPGIGTYTSTKTATPFVSRIQKTLDEMVAWNLDSYVVGGYEFLVQNYVEGDKICIFGFSRGAHIARGLAGMLHKIGLLPADNLQKVLSAYKIYRRNDITGWKQSSGFKRAFCTHVSIEFIGVWDTADSIGLIPKRLPFTASNTIVRTFRHALALDERRAKVKVTFWKRPDKKRNNKEQKNGHTGTNQKKLLSEEQNDGGLNEMEETHPSQKTTNIEEVWFAGYHADVGGGSVSSKTRYSLARVSLRWMVRECFKTNTGIMFGAKALSEICIDPATLYPFVTPRPPPLPICSDHKIRKPPAKSISARLHSTAIKAQLAQIHAEGTPTLIRSLGCEEEEELRDALSPAYDQLNLKKSWWLLEILPLRYRYQRDNNEWVSYFGLNLARPRFIPKQLKSGVYVHRSVKLRMEAGYEDETKKGKNYKPKPHLLVEPTWVD